MSYRGRKDDKEMDAFNDLHLYMNDLSGKGQSRLLPKASFDGEVAVRQVINLFLMVLCFICLAVLIWNLVSGPSPFMY